MVTSVVLLWVMVLGLGAVVLALIRQIGLLHERLAPIGALTLQNTLSPGGMAPRIGAAALSGDPVVVGGARATGTLQLLMFVSPTCPICKTLLPTAKAFANAEALDLVLIGDGELKEHRGMAERFDISPAKFVVSAEVGRAFQVVKLPHAVLISDTGVLLSQGLVNTREHLESLLVAHETGTKSVQEYLDGRRSKSIQYV